MTSRKEILRLERQQEQDFNRHRIDRCVALFDAGFVGFSSTRHARIAGRAALRKTFEYYVRLSPRMRYRISQPRVQLFDGAGVVTFYWKVTLGSGRHVRGRGSHVFLRRGKTWRIVHEHFSRAH